MRGYFNRGSDLDLIILWDSSVTDIFSQARFTNFSHQEDRNYNRKVRIQSKVKDINPSIIGWGPDGIPHPEDLGDLFRLVTGKKIDRYRQYWIDTLNAVSPKKKEGTLQGAAIILAEDDLRGWEKIAERISGIKRNPGYFHDPEFWQEIMNKISAVPKRQQFYRHRVQLWRRRLDHFFGKEEITVVQSGVIKRVLKGIGIVH